MRVENAADLSAKESADAAAITNFVAVGDNCI
jgi:hypothetical protein